MNDKQREVLTELLPQIEKELDGVVEFWMKHSLDSVYGGFFTCLDIDGSVFDDTKYVWLQSRQVWMLMRLYIDVERFHKKEILEAALKGADFLLNKCRVDRGSYCRCAFSLTRDGKPLKIQRSLFSEVFFVMAMSEAWRRTEKDKYKNAAVLVMSQIRKWCLVDDAELGREELAGCVPTSSLAVPMMALYLCQQMQDCCIDWSDDSDVEEWAVKQMFLHVQRGGSKVLENVSASGEELPGSNGRLQIPGHAIEGGWFLLDYFKEKNLKGADEVIKAFIEEPYKQGWDKDHGGLLYFMDVDGFPPIQLEWNMKLWWPHNEAMIAFLKAYQHDQSPSHIEKFIQVTNYAFEKFSDKEQGEWFGYLNQRGEVSSRFKGSPWKGFFHIPRCLYLCEKIIKELLKD